MRHSEGGLRREAKKGKQVKVMRDGGIPTELGARWHTMFLSPPLHATGTVSEYRQGKGGCRVVVVWDRWDTLDKKLKGFRISYHFDRLAYHYCLDEMADS